MGCGSHCDETSSNDNTNTNNYNNNNENTNNYNNNNEDEYESPDSYDHEKPAYKLPLPTQPAVQPQPYKPDSYSEPEQPNPYLERAAVHLPYTTYRNQLCSGKQIGSSQGESIGSAVLKCVQLGCEAANAIPRGDGKYDCTFLHGVQTRSASPGAYCVSGKQLPQMNHLKQAFKSRRFQVQQQAAVLNSDSSATASAFDGYEDFLDSDFSSTSLKPSPTYEGEEDGLPIELRKLVIASSTNYAPPPYIPKPITNGNNYVPPYIAPPSPSIKNSVAPPSLPSRFSSLPSSQPPSHRTFDARSVGSDVRYKPLPAFVPSPRENAFQAVPSPFARK
uniref:Uncharacterized protein n=1 Tax=Plectus sambesii TaxID=2011161 RepID=A0A914VHW8_9BILA